MVLGYIQLSSKTQANKPMNINQNVEMFDKLIDDKISAIYIKLLAQFTEYLNKNSAHLVFSNKDFTDRIQLWMESTIKRIIKEESENT